MARKVGLDRRQVIDAATALADIDGLASVSLARIAADLVVASPSPYTTPGRLEDPALFTAFALHGFVSLEATGGFGLSDDVGESFETLIDVIAAGMLARSPAVPPEPRRGGAHG